MNGIEQTQLTFCLLAGLFAVCAVGWAQEGGTPKTHGTSAVRIEKNRFVLTSPGQPFTPRGFNLIRLDLEGGGGHATFSPFIYNREKTGATLKHMAENGFNIVRVFINGNWGKRGTLLEKADAENLSSAYLDNLTDFLKQAHTHGILVIPCFEGFPDASPYRKLMGDKVENLEGFVNHYLNPGFIAAKRAYLQDAIRGIRQRDPSALQSVFCWDVMNEVNFELGHPPFSLNEGKITPANGVTYDLATDKVRMADEMAVYWIDQMADAIRAEIPDALIDANIFTYHAVGRSGPGDFHQDPADWKNRYPFRPLALLQSKADVIDIHFYSDSEVNWKKDLASIEHEQLLTGMKEHPTKALLVGEFGAFNGRFPKLPEAAQWVSHLATHFPDAGFQGWVYWTYDTDEQKELWNGMSDGAQILKSLPAEKITLLSGEALWKQVQDDIKANPEALKVLAADADRYLAATPVDVVSGKKHLAPTGDPHDYVSIAPYSWPNPKKADGLPWINKDGEVNPVFYEYDNMKLETLCYAVPRLILYARTTGSAPHARAAGKYLRAWFVDEATRMNPNLRYAQFVPGVCDGRGIGIIDTTSLVFLLDAITHLEFNEAWTPEHLASLKQWVSQYLDWLKQSDFGKKEESEKNNHGSWLDAQVVCYATFCGRPELIAQQIEKYTKGRIASQIEADGAQPHELKRTLSLTYCTYNLLAHTCIAQIARNQGIDLWTWKSPNGRSLRQALNWMLPYYAREREWTQQQIKAFDFSSAVLLLTLARSGPGDAVPANVESKIETYPWQRLIFSKASISGRAVPRQKLGH